MKILSLPFTRQLGITLADESEYLLQLNYSNNILNHIGTVHASASYALAETTSGYFLNDNFKDIADSTIPILRLSTVKYRKAGLGNLFSTAKFIGINVKDILQQLNEKRKVHLIIQVPE